MCVVIIQYNENQKLRDQVIDYEKEQWYRLLRMTEYVEEFQINSKFSDEYNNHIYANQICHGFMSNYELSSLLRETYDPLHLELSILEDGPNVVTDTQFTNLGGPALAVRKIPSMIRACKLTGVVTT